MIPWFLDHLEVDPRGYPIPFTVWYDKEGKPDFRVTDQNKWLACAEQRLCGVCGEKLEYWIFFVGGPKAIETRTFYDPPMHDTCASYSVMLCPHLNNPEAQYGTRPLNLDGDTKVIEIESVSSRRAERIGIGRTREYSLISYPASRDPEAELLTFFRAQPFKEVLWADDPEFPARAKQALKELEEEHVLKE
jgi:hypothetical protein